MAVSGDELQHDNQKPKEEMRLNDPPKVLWAIKIGVKMRLTSQEHDWPKHWLKVDADEQREQVKIITITEIKLGCRLLLEVSNEVSHFYYP